MFRRQYSNIAKEDFEKSATRWGALGICTQLIEMALGCLMIPFLHQFTTPLYVTATIGVFVVLIVLTTLIIIRNARLMSELEQSLRFCDKKTDNSDIAKNHISEGEKSYADFQKQKET